MKRIAQRINLASFIVIFALLSISVFAGSLTPLGTPGPTMKPLSEIEPRIPIKQSDLPLTISQPGSYYFTENLNGPSGEVAIRVSSSNVTIDLMGFTLFGPGAGGSAGIYSDVVGTTGCVVRNGVITGFGQNGVLLYDSSLDFSENCSLT